MTKRKNESVDVLQSLLYILGNPATANIQVLRRLETSFEHAKFIRKIITHTMARQDNLNAVERGE